MDFDPDASIDSVDAPAPAAVAKAPKVAAFDANADVDPETPFHPDAPVDVETPAEKPVYTWENFKRGLSVYKKGFSAENRAKVTLDTVNQQMAPQVALPRAPQLGPGVEDEAYPGTPFTLGQVAAAYNTAAPLIEGSTSKVALGALPIGVAGKSIPVARGISTALAAAFAALMAHGTAEQVVEAKKVLADPKSTHQQITESLLAPAASALMTAGGVAGAVHETAALLPEKETSFLPGKDLTDTLSPVPPKLAKFDSEAPVDVEAPAPGKPEVAAADTTQKTTDVPSKPAEFSADAPVEPVETPAAAAPEVRYTVQRDLPHPTDATKTIPGYTQIDIAENGVNTRSSNLADLRKEGIDLPDVPEHLPTGQYSLDEIKAAQENPPSDKETEAPVSAAPEGNKVSPPEEATGAAPAGNNGELGAADSPPVTPAPEEKPAAMPDDVTGIKNASVDAELAKMGRPAMTHGEGLAMKQGAEDAAQQIKDDPGAPLRLIQEVEATNRPLSAHEDHLLLHEMTRLKGELENAKNAETAAEASGDAVAISAARVRFAEVDDSYTRAASVATKAGTENALGLAHRKAMMKDDFSLASMLTRKRRAVGGKLSPEQTSDVVTLQKKMVAAEQAHTARVQQLEAEKSDLQATNQILRMIKQVKGERKPVKPGAVAKFISDQATAARERMRQRAGQVSAGIDPTALADIAIVGADYLVKGVVKGVEWSTAMVKEFGEKIRPHLDTILKKAEESRILMTERAGSDRDTPAERTSTTEGLRDRLKQGDTLSESKRYVQKLAEQFIRDGVHDRDALIDSVHGVLKEIDPKITRRATMDAISGYGDFKPVSKDPVKAELSDLKGQMQQLGKLEDMEKGRAPAKTGIERRPPSAIERRLIQQVEAAKRKGGFVVTDPARQLQSALASTKTRLRNEISDLEFQISTGKKTIPEKGVTPVDTESTALKARRDALKQEYDRIFTKPGLTDAQRLAAAGKSTDRQIAELERQLRTNELFDQSKVQPVTSPELEAKRARLDALKQEREYGRHLVQPAAEPKTELETKAAALDRQIAQVEKQLKDGAVFSKETKKPADTSPELADRQQRLADLKYERQNLRDQLQPKAEPKSPEELARQARKTRLTSRIADLQDRLAKSDFSKAPPREAPTLDPEEQARAEKYAGLKREFQEGLLRDELKHRTALEKTQDALVGWRRFNLLSGPITLAKLTSAAAQRIAFSPVEELAGGALSKLVPGVAKRAPSEGGFSVSAEVKAISSVWRDSISESAKVLKTGKSRLDTLYGQTGKVKSDDVLPPSFRDFFGRLHAALKTPVKIAAWTRSFEKRLAFAERNGLDPHDPAVQLKAGIAAYKDSKRSIFLQDNKVVTAYNRAVQALMEKGPEGKPTPGATLGATALKFALPIVRVPTNLVAEAFQYATGSVTGSARLANAFRKGTEHLSEDQADLIMRDLKKGSIGAAVLAVGYFNADKIGGYYQPGEKRDASDVKAGRIRAFGYDVPSYLLHNPLLEVLQIGATIRRVMDSKLRPTDDEKQGVGRAVWASALGLAEHTPFASEGLNLAKLADPAKRADAAGELAKSILVPRGVSDIAEAMDRRNGEPVRRKAETIPEHLQSGIPGARESLPAQTSLSPAERTIRELASHFKEEHGIAPFQGSGYYPYDALTSAVQSGDTEAARSALADLVERKARTVADATTDVARRAIARREISEYYQREASLPFTGSLAREAKFRGTLDAEQKEMYTQAKAERRQQLLAVQALLSGK